MSLLARPLTSDDLDDMPDDGNRYELIGGELIVSRSATTLHSRIVGKLVMRISHQVDVEALGLLCMVPVDTRLSPHNVVVPDLLFICNERLDMLYPPEGPVSGSPDLVVEVMTPETRNVDRIVKAALYADHGVPEYWLVDPMERTVEVLTLDGGLYVPVAPDAEGVLASTVIPGLTVDPEALFADIV